MAAAAAAATSLKQPTAKAMRPRNLDPAKPVPVIRSEEDPDVLAESIDVVRQTQPIVTGMEKEEEEVSVRSVLRCLVSGQWLFRRLPRASGLGHLSKRAHWHVLRAMVTLAEVAAPRVAVLRALQNGRLSMAAHFLGGCGNYMMQAD